MSHVTTVDLEMRDLDDIGDAGKRCGLELVRGQTSFRWYGHALAHYPLPEGFTAEDLGKCDHVLRIPGNDRAYEIGIVKRRDGRPGYTLLWDFYAGGFGLEERVGPDCSKLKQAYGVAVAARQLRRQGYRVREQHQADGSVVLRATGGSS